MHISYQLTRDDVREALKRHGGFAMKSLPVFGFLLVAGALFTLFTKQGTYGSAFVSGMLGCFWILIPRWQARQAVKNASRILDPVEVTISDTGIDSSNSVAATRLNWEAFARYVETKNLFLVYPSRIMFHIYPKRAFAPEEIETFRGMLEGHLGVASKAYRRKIGAKRVVFGIIVLAAALLLVTQSMIRSRNASRSAPQETPATEQDGTQR